MTTSPLGSYPAILLYCRPKQPQPTNTAIFGLAKLGVLSAAEPSASYLTESGHVTLSSLADSSLEKLR